MKTTRRHGATDAKEPKTTRLNVRIDAEAQRRLAVHCAMTGLSPGEVLTRLIHGLRDWSMPVNLVNRSANSHRQAASDGANVSVDQHAESVAA